VTPHSPAFKNVNSFATEKKAQRQITPSAIKILKYLKTTKLKTGYKHQDLEQKRNKKNKQLWPALHVEMPGRPDVTNGAEEFFRSQLPGPDGARCLYTRFARLHSYHVII
jgi:hypothetical protein